MKFYPCVYFLVLATLFSVQILAQTPRPTASPQPEDDGEIVKITTSLIQLDAIVMDEKGDPVTDLTVGDFEILQDGQIQKISNFLFVDTSVEGSRIKTRSKTGNQTVVPPTRRRINSTGRVITFVVDDGSCSTSAAGMRSTRDALKKFINEQMQANDLVAIYRTRSGSSLLQQYTSDRSQLLKIVKKVRWLPSLGCGGSGDFFESERQWQDIPLKEEAADSSDGETTEERNRRLKEEIRDTNRDNKIVGTLGVIRYIVNGMSRIRGRKLMFLMSDGIPTLDESGNSQRAREHLRSLTNEANRAAVVINTVDVRGVTNPLFISAADDIKPDINFGSDNNSTRRVSESRLAQSRDLQSGLALLADETGGEFYRGNNDLSVHLRKAMNLERGYYLLGYEPTDEVFKGPKFHTIEIRLKRPELRVFSRAGFVGAERQKRARRTGDSELYEALTAPLPNAGLGLRLTAFFGNTRQKGNFIRSLIHIDGSDIRFADSEDRRKKAVFDVIAVTMNEKNEVVDEFNRTHTVRVRQDAIPFIKENGLVYLTEVNVKKSGVYNFRVAVRDVNSALVGSAVQIVRVPKLDKGKIFLSGLTIAGAGKDELPDPSSAVSLENAVSLVGSKDISAIRSFSAGDTLAFGYRIYNAKPDRSTKRPKIAVMVNLYQNGEIIAKGSPKTADYGRQEDWARIKAKGSLRLPYNAPSGDYALQVVVRDLLTRKTASQWIDFEVAN
ncbi:MAG: VWA domain-containing protein [Pyrinomonadaceae bacterium]|nr:VWA domain-containing protein [Pyrinomonadaceae bacterium]